MVNFFEFCKCSLLKCCDLLDALYRATKKAQTGGTLGGVIGFQLHELDFKQFSIQELIETAGSADPLE